MHDTTRTCDADVDVDVASSDARNACKHVSATCSRVCCVSAHAGLCRHVRRSVRMGLRLDQERGKTGWRVRCDADVDVDVDVDADADVAGVMYSSAHRSAS